jgi:hypothetical protein
MIDLLRKAKKEKGVAGQSDGTITNPEHVCTGNCCLHYPKSAVGVMKAFLADTLHGSPITVDEMSDCSEAVSAQRKYFPLKQEISPDDMLVQFEKIGIDYNIVSGCKIIRIDQECPTSAIIVVRYSRIGTLDEHAGGCQIHDAAHQADNPYAQPELRETNCNLFTMTNDTVDVVYKLRKPGRYWRVSATSTAHISLEAAIKTLECILKARELVLSSKHISQIKADIETLKKHSSFQGKAHDGTVSSP